MDDQIDKEEMLAFFDSNMPNGKKYDREVADKIFKVFDTDNSGKITVDEFIKTFIHLEEELKEFKIKLKAKYLSEQAKCDELNEKAELYRNKEKINSEGLSNFANFNCEIKTVEFPKSFKGIDAIKIRVNYGNESKITKVIYINNFAADFSSESLNL